MNVNALKTQSQSLTTVAEASDSFGVSETTIRKWASDFAGNLSPGANPGRGQSRTFSDEDIVVLTTISHQRSANVSYGDIHKVLRNDRTKDLELPVDKLPDDQNQPSTLSTSQQYEDRLMRLEEERDQLLMHLKATKAELTATQNAQAGGQETETSMKDAPVRDLHPPDPTKADRPGVPQADPGRIITLEDQLKHIGKKPWWQVWKR